MNLVIVNQTGNQFCIDMQLILLRNKIELIQGTQLNDDPYVSIFPNI